MCIDPQPKLTMSPVPPRISRSVAVIGAGASGLVAARELRREGHNVVVFERENRIGGTWVYTPETEPDPLGLDPNRKPIIHSSLYKSLRTNLPREIMGFTDYPFLCKGGEKGGDPRRFPGHEEVLRYLEDFADEFGVREMVGFEREVVKVCLVDRKWVVKWREMKIKRNDLEEEEEVEEEAFDAVVVCNGHHTEPRVAEIPGMSKWPRRQLHSHNYRTPEPYRDQVVVLIGSSWSAMDISREIAKVAKDVHIASWSFEGSSQKQPRYNNMWLHPMIESVHEDGTVVFLDGSSTNANIILHCTGYKYHFPFLETNGIVTVDDNRVGPLYKHVFPPTLAPWLSFVGIPWKSVLFPLFEMQSKWIAGVLSDRIVLPSQEEMMEDIERFYSSLEASSIPKRYTHNLFPTRFEYFDWLVAESGCPPADEWRKEMYIAALKNVEIRPEAYHDEWEDNHLISQAHGSFKKYIFKQKSNKWIIE